MRALIAGPRTAVGGFQTKLAVFKPSPAAEKLFGIGIGESNAPTVASSVFPVVLLVPVLMSYVRTQRSEVAVAQSGTTNAPVLGFTSRGELRVIVVVPMTSGLAGSGTK